MVDRIRPPRVTVEQQIANPTPTVQTPVQMPCAVGPCFYKLEAVDSNGSSNAEATLTSPAVILAGTAGPYTGLGGKEIKVQYKDYVAESVTFPADVSDPSAAFAASVINDAGLTGIRARAIKNSSGQDVLMFYTTAVGDNEEFKLLTGSPDGLGILGIASGKKSYGLYQYNQSSADIVQAVFPDPDGLLEDLDIVEDDIRIFLMTGPNDLYECKRDRSFLRNFGTAQVLGTVDLSIGSAYPDNYIDKTLTMSVTPGDGQKSLSLLQSVREGVINLINDACQMFMNHKNNEGGAWHSNVDDVNSVAGLYPLPSNASLASIIALATSLRDEYNGHDNQATDSGGVNVVHTATGGHQASTATPSTWADVVTLINDVKAKYNAHIVDGAAHNTADSVPGVNDIATADAVNGDSSTIVGDISSTWPEATVMLSSNHLMVASMGKVEIAETDGSLAVFGLTGDDLKSYAASVYDDNDGDTQSPLVKINYPTGELPPTTSPTMPASVIAGNTWSSISLPITGKVLTLSVDGEPAQEIEFTADETTPDLVMAKINEVMGLGTATDDGSGHLKISSGLLGTESVVEIDPSCTAYPVFAFPNPMDRGDSYPVKVGYELWADGEYLGTISSIVEDHTSGPDLNYLIVKISSEYDLDKTWSSAYVYATGLSYGTADEPVPDLVVDGHYNIIKHEILRDHRGDIADASAPIIVSYRGLRLDVSTASDNPSLLVFDTIEEIEAQLGPATPQNPLSFALVQMKSAGPNIQVAGIGVEEISDDAPEGTLDAYRKAFEMLASWDVYYIVALTFDYSVLQALRSHVEAFSQKEESVWRIGMGTIRRPEREADVAIVSGADGESAGVGEFNTKVAALPALLMQAGVDSSGGLTIEDGVFLDIEADDRRYLISQVNGSYVTIDHTFTSDENRDGFYTTEQLPTNLLQQTFTIYVRGKEISQSYSQAVAYQQFGKGVKGRMVLSCPDYLTYPVDGIDTLVEGYYGVCSLAGLAAQLPPQQPLSNMAIPGFTSAIRSFPYFTKDQMDIIAGGGVLIFWQEKPGQGSVLIRHQLMTDTDDIKTRELSVRRAVDFFSKIILSALKPHAGRHNINGDGFNLDMLVDAAIKFAVDNNVVLGAKLISVTPSESQADKLAIKIQVELFVPGNVFEVTLLL